MGKLFFGSSWWLCWLKVVMEQELMTGHSHVLVLAMQLYAGFFPDLTQISLNLISWVFTACFGNTGNMPYVQCTSSYFKHSQALNVFLFGDQRG